MPKSRRKKGSVDGPSLDDDREDALSEDHTVADTIATLEDDLGGDDPKSIEEWIDAAGDHGSESASNNNARQAAALTNLLDDLLESKKKSVREGGLKRLFRAVSNCPHEMVLAEEAYYSDSITQICTTSLRGGSPSEQYASCRVLEAFSILLGADHDDYCTLVSKPLQRVVNMASRAMLVRCAALRAMTVSSLLCADDMDAELLLMCEAMATEEEYRNQVLSPSLKATALDCWTLLMTGYRDDASIAGDEEGRGLPLLTGLLECLQTGHLELQAAAGTAMSLIHSARLNLVGLNVDNGTERKYAKGSWQDSVWEDTFMEIQHIVMELSNQSGHTMSKRAKKEQRKRFREYVATICEDEGPSEVVSFRGGSLTLSSWREVVQLDFVRHSLQGGFQIQLLTNPTLQALLGADGSVLNRTPQTYSQLEKRLLWSKTSEASKLAHMDLTKKRRVRNNVKNHFITGDGDDI